MLFSGKWLEIEVILTKETRFRKTNTALTLICGIWTGMCRVLREGTWREEEEISRGGNGIRVSWKQRMDTSSRRAEGWGGQWRRKMKKNKVWWLTESAIIKTITLCTNFKINFSKREHCRKRTDQGKCVVYSCWLSSVLRFRFGWTDEGLLNSKVIPDSQGQRAQIWVESFERLSLNDWRFPQRPQWMQSPAVCRVSEFSKKRWCQMLGSWCLCSICREKVTAHLQSHKEKTVTKISSFSLLSALIVLSMLNVCVDPDMYL